MTYFLPVTSGLRGRLIHVDEIAPPASHAGCVFQLFEPATIFLGRQPLLEGSSVVALDPVFYLAMFLY